MITTVRPSRRALFRGAPPVNADDGRPIPTSAKETIGSPAAELGYRPALDGLRAVAVIAVLFFHARFSWAKGGFLGVSTFFTLSGFLITTLLISEHHRSGGISLRSFWTRRFRRLLPAAWMTLAGVVGASAFGVWNDDQMRALRGDVPSAFLQLINWHFVAGGRSYGDQFAAPSPLEHFWSLAIEEQFYVVFPLVALLALRWAKGRRWPLAAAMGVMAVMSAIVSGLTAGGSTGRAYFGTDTRLMELCIGVILATVLSGRFTAVTQRARSWLVLPGLFAVVVTGWSWTHFTVESRSLYPWGLLMTAACSAALITAALQPGLISSALSVAPMRWIGRLSYGIYLIHWPVFLWLTPTRTDLGAWPLFVLRMAVTLVLAMASNRLVEDPIRRRRRLTGPIRGAVVPGFIGAVLIVLVLTTADLPAVRELDRASATGPIAAAAPPPTRVLIVGDRLAASLGAGLANVDASTFVVKVDADPDCGVVTGGFVQLPDGTVEFDSARCRSVRAHQQATEAAFRPDVVLVWSGMRDVANRRLSNNEPWGQPGVADVDDLLRTEVAATVDGLSKGGATVMWMTMPLVSDTENPPPPPPPAAGEPGHGQYQELQLEGARKDAPAAAFVQNDPARVTLWNSLVTKEVVKRGGRVLQAASLLNGWSDGSGVGAADTTVRSAGVGVTQRGALDLLDWMGPTIRPVERASVVAAATAPVSSGADQPFPVAPPASPRRSVPAGGQVRTLTVGDSVGVNFAFGLRDWQEATKSPVAVYSSAQLGCALARGGSYRFLNEVNKLGDRCDWAAPATWAAALADARPDVVLMVSGIWEVADRLLPGDSEWRHVGDPTFDHYLVSEWLAAIDYISSQGATVVMTTYPHFQAGRDQGFTDLPESDPARVDRLNQLIHQVAALRPGIAGVVDFQGWLAAQPGGEFDEAKRDDGLHFKDTYLPTIGGWIGPQLERVAHSGTPPPA